MNVLRQWPWLVALMLLAPTALAAPALSAASFTLAGETSLRGDASALFLQARETPFDWDVAALGGDFTRYSASTFSVENPLQPAFPAFQREPEWTVENEPFGPLTLGSTDVASGGALLVLSDGATVEANSPGLVSLRAISDPRIEQMPQDAATPGADDGFIRHELIGDFLNATFSDGALTVRGDITIILFGPAYTLTADGSTREEWSGVRETQTTALTSEGRMERHVYALKDAVLRVRAPSSLDLYTRQPELAFTGTLQAETAEGALELGGAEVPVGGNGALTWAGSATLHLTLADGRIFATTPAPLETSGGAIVSKGAPPLLLAAIATGLLGLAALVFLLLRRRARAASDLDVALLAMEERRWEEALPRLTRLAKKDPQNVVVQIDRALCLENVGRLPEASKAFEAALRSQPAHAEAHFYYARTLAKMREREMARVHLETALERDPRLVELARQEAILKGL